MRPRGESASSPSTRYVGQSLRQRPHEMHVARSSELTWVEERAMSLAYGRWPSAPGASPPDSARSLRAGVFSTIPRHPRTSTLFPYTTLFRPFSRRGANLDPEI